jgi:hypothetical protein
MEDVSKEASASGFDDDDLLWYQQGNSRIGANVKAGDISGKFEYGTGVNLRVLQGTWNFGAGKFEVGQDYTPIDTFISSQCGPSKYGGDICGLGYGAPYSGRLDQAKLMIAGFQVALIEPKVSSPDTYSAITGDPAYPAIIDTDTSIPRIEASYNLKLGPAALKLFGGMNTSDDVKIVAGAEKEYSVDSNVFGVMGQYATGPFSVAADIYMATNPGNYGLLQDNGIAVAYYNGANDSIEDVDSMAALVVLGYQATPTIKLEAGYGMVANELDATGGTAEATTTTMYIQANIALAKGFYLVPEFGTIDYGDLEVTGAPDTKLGDISYYGAKWHINF